MLLSISASDLNAGKKVWVSAGTTQNVLFHLLYPTGFPRNFLYMVDMQPMHPRNLVPTKSSRLAGSGEKFIEVTCFIQFSRCPVMVFN